jgi:pimeloyl-ACP methyl ester carboxylesterase
VAGGAVADADVRRAGAAWKAIPWADLSTTTLEPGKYDVRVRLVAPDGAGVAIPVCAGRGAVRIDGRDVAAPAGPLAAPVAAGPHEVLVAVEVSRYERRIACGEPVRVGPLDVSRDGLGVLSFDSPYAARGGGQAVVYVPPGLDLRDAPALLVGLHPWNGTIWTYAAYEELLAEARDRSVVLLMPSGLGNSLYTADAEDEVLRAIDALGALRDGSLPSDLREGRARPWNISLWGASMGGAGATTIGFHHPDRFASVTSFFGDSRYDLGTYVRAILPDERAAHLVNALDVVDNARNLPVWLVHGEADATSPIRQSVILADALRERGFHVRFDRVPGEGHSGALVARYLRQLVDDAADATTCTRPDRVTYRSVRPADTGAYGIRIERATAGDAFVDAQRTAGGYHVLRSEGVRAVTFEGTP